MQGTTTQIQPLPRTVSESSAIVPKTLTRLVWALWIVSLGLFGYYVQTGQQWQLGGVLAVDGLTVLMWLVVTFFSGIVHSYSRRYMAGSKQITAFFLRISGFTLAVMVLVAADHLALFGLAWLAMGLVMAGLIGQIQQWPQAQAAARIARRQFLASSLLVAIALSTLWLKTGEPTVSAALSRVGSLSQPTVLFVAGTLLLAAMIQSALVPFHTWLLSSMTAPTPASALMHAGFVNAGGILLTRFAPIITQDSRFMLVVAIAGGASALLGKLLKSVQPDIKRQLGCSTVGQMGFMIMQAGLGFFGAAITHLVLHGFYKAYNFLSAGDQIDQQSPDASKKTTDSLGVSSVLVTLVTAVAGGGLFALLTGKGTHLDSGVLLTLFVVLTTLHATRQVLRHSELPAVLRYGSVPLLFLPAIGLYALAYNAVTAVIGGVTAPTPLSPVHGLLAGLFVLAYVTIETGIYRNSKRLYVALLNYGRPASETLLTATEEYNEY